MNDDRDIRTLPFALPDVTEAEVAAVTEVLRSRWLTTGKQAAEFERRFAEHVSAPYAVALNSCTAALHLALEALGVGPGDLVYVPTYTFAASGEVVRYLGATPVLVDVDPDTLNIDLEQLRSAVKSDVDGERGRPRAVIPVHFAGVPCDMEAVWDLAREHDLAVVEDAAHAFPAWRDSRITGDMPEDVRGAVCFSFYATKTITTGEGGMVVTPSEEMAERMRSMSLHGLSRQAWNRYSAKGSWRYDIVAAGYKYNLTDVAAAMGLVQLERAEEMRRKREEIAGTYIDRLADLPLQLPTVPEGVTSAATFRGADRRGPARRLHRRADRARHRDQRALHPAPPAQLLPLDLRLPARRLPGGARAVRAGRLAADLERDDRPGRRAGGERCAREPGRHKVTVITGGFGFLGWHLACRLRAVEADVPARVGRREFAGPEALAASLAGADTVYHLAGVNRADSDDAVESGNVELADKLAVAVRGNARPVHLVYGNSTQSRLDNPYGRGKRAAAEILGAAVDDVGGTMADVVLPNLFGEHGRPAYNSFVATFCHEVAHGRTPTVSGDRAIPLLHAQAAAAALVDASRSRVTTQLAPEGTERGISEVLNLVLGYHELYARGELPPLDDPFGVDLFNTFRSYVFPQHFPFHVNVHRDARGDLFEAVRAHGGTGQAFVSTTVPGATRGDHYHLHKVERFLVVKGEAEIALRRLYDDQIVRFRLSGAEPAFVDMPTMWVHNITNVGEEELVTAFWADQLLDPARPDQYPERVELPA